MLAKPYQALDDILTEYSSGEHREALIEAKSKYIELTGNLDEENSAYESRMNCFNDWYLHLFISARGNTTVIKNFIENNSVDEELRECLTNINYSLFQFIKRNLKKEIVLKDILHNKKVVLPKDHRNIGIVSGDLFVGRVVTFGGDNYLLQGICLLPTAAKALLAKQSKKIRKLGELEDEHRFLLKLENYAVKHAHYKHVDVKKIFVFQD